MSILVTADVHLSDSPRDEYRHAFMEGTLPALIRKYRVQQLLILGDLTEAKAGHSAWLVNEMVRHFQCLADLCEVVVLKGNHDYIVADTPFFKFLGKLDEVRWVNTPERIELPRIGEALFLPHSPNPERDWKDLDLTTYDLIFAHQTFTGASIGPRKMEGVDQNIFHPHARIISGDIHVPQTFGRVTYTGSPALIDFGDNFEPRVLLLEGDKVRSIPCPGPQKRLVEINDISELSAERGLNVGDILKVRVGLSPADHARWPEIQARVREWSDLHGYNIYLVQPQVVQPQGKASAEKRKVTVRTDEQLLAQYASTRAVGQDTLAVGLELLRRA